MSAAPVLPRAPEAGARKVRHAHLTSASRLVTLEAPLSCGQGRPGPQRAPSAITGTGVFRALRRKEWDVAPADGPGMRDTRGPRKERNETNHARGAAEPFHGRALLADALEQVSRSAERHAWMRDFVLTLGGDHSVAAGSVHGLSRAWDRLGVVWVDAHADFNSPETSPSGNFHGMPLAALCGAFPLASVPGFEWFAPCLAKEDVVLVGVRSIDEREAALLREWGLRCYSSADVAARGMASVMADARAHLLARGPRPLHLSFDIDALDALLVPGTGTPEPGGLSLEEAEVLCGALHETGLLVGMDLVEVNTDLEAPSDTTSPSGSLTLGCAVAVLLAALGFGPRSGG